MDLAVVMPIYNEEANIEKVIAEWTSEFQRMGITFVILAVNDGSRDRTGAVLEGLAGTYPATLAINQPNAGHGRACRRGYEQATNVAHAAWTLQIDSDGQCDPVFFDAFWNARHEADCVFGLRTTRDDGAMRTLVSAACRAVTALIGGMDLKDANVPYRLIQTDVLARALAKIPEDFDMQNVALSVALKRDPALRWKYVSIHFRTRQGGSNSINLSRILAMGWELVRQFKRIGR